LPPDSESHAAEHAEDHQCCSSRAYTRGIGTIRIREKGTQILWQGGDNLSYGTPYHWGTPVPVESWHTPIFQAMHDYLLPQESGQVLGAIFQSTIPAWAVDASGAQSTHECGP
jgi:hypothetical protein